MTGGEGNDSLLGADGGDSIAGNAGNDTIRSGADNDSVTGGDGSDLIDGGSDNDTINSGPGADTVVGGSENDSIFGEGGDDSLVGDDGNDTIDAGPGQDIVLGDIGDDSIQGGDDNDVINGSIGSDTIAGGSGSDRLTGGAGNDFFFYEVADQGIDTIIDFDRPGDDDTFLFTSANFGGLTNSGFSSVIVQDENIGSEGQSIGDAELIIFEGKFDNAQAVNAALNVQNGSSDRPAFFVYLNGQRGKYVLGYDTSLADDSVPAFELGILKSIPPEANQISTIIDAGDFEFI
ncbi:MAG: calcium-binding protein [Okeania sp. SIO3B3]|nr:calcium-binding protein [Okeania sp. SIO3B3]